MRDEEAKKVSPQIQVVQVPVVHGSMRDEEAMKVCPQFILIICFLFHSCVLAEERSKYLCEIIPKAVLFFRKI